MRYFITGTDTDVGKTYVTCLLLKALHRAGFDAVGYKPVCCGSRQDAIDLWHAGGGVDTLVVEQVNPVYYPMAAAPMTAALIENRSVDLGSMEAGWQVLAERYEHILVEGAGGWEVPLRADFSMSDFAAWLQLPVLLVVNNKLGALNHTVLTARAIAARGLTCAGMILNSVHDERDSASISNRMILSMILPEVPVVAEIMHGETEFALTDLTLTLT